MSKLWISQCRSWVRFAKYQVSILDSASPSGNKSFLATYTKGEGSILYGRCCTPRPLPNPEESVSNQNGVEAISADGTLYYSPLNATEIPFVDGLTVAASTWTHKTPCNHCGKRITVDYEVISIASNESNCQVQSYWVVADTHGHTNNCYVNNNGIVIRLLAGAGNGWALSYNDAGNRTSAYVQELTTAYRNACTRSFTHKEWNDLLALYPKTTLLRYFQESAFYQTYSSSWEPTRVRYGTLYENDILREEDLPWPGIGASWMEKYFPYRERANADWPTLAAISYSKISFGAFQSNGLAFLRDTALMTDAAKKLYKTVSAVLKVSPGTARYVQLAKTAAGVFLALHYGLKLQLIDTQELFTSLQGVDPNGFQHTVGRSDATYPSGVSWEYTYHTCIDTFSGIPTELDRLIHTFDLDLSLENVWDLVPFSFVMDWCIDVQSICDVLDRWYRTTSVESKIKYIGRTEKARRRVSAEAALGNGLKGGFTLTYYRRRYSTRPVTPNPFYHSQPGIPSTNHFVEGAALVTTFT